MGGKTKEALVEEAMAAPKVIDPTVEFKIPKVTYQEKVSSSKYKWKCTCCGKRFTGERKKNFQRTSSPLFQSDDGFLPWCKECTDKYVSLLTEFYSGNEEHAIEHFCEQVDWVYDIEPLKYSRELMSDRSRISHYAAKKNINVGGRKTYIDTLRDNYLRKQGEIINSIEQIENSDKSISASVVNRWGLGLAESDYKILEEHYRMLKRNNPNCDNNQEIFIKSLCNLNLLMVKAIKSENSEKYVKLTAQYAKTFKEAGLKTVDDRDESMDECLGVTLATISQYTPEEYYKDKTLYKDFDKIGEYFDRFIKRPLKNLMFGTNERDSKYRVLEEDENADE